MLSRKRSEAALAHETDVSAIPTVSIIQPLVGRESPNLILPGDIEAWYWAPVYGQVSGYVKDWDKDIGAQVRKGDILATIAVPELDANVEKAKADVARAKADEELADITAVRWNKLWKTDAVSRQETDVAVDKLKAAHAATLAAQGELDRLEALQAFEKLVAPFDGVVTARRTDVGAFVKANGESSEPSMFEVADVHMMRVYVRVPQTYASQIRVGMSAYLILPSMPDQPFPATVKTTAASINLDSRTLLVELWVPNPGHELNPGTYAEVHFNLPGRLNAVQIPSSARIFQDNGLPVAVVDPTGHAHLRSVTIGRDMGASVIVTSGSTAADRVIDSPPDALDDGDQVRVVGTDGVFPGLERSYRAVPAGILRSRAAVPVAVHGCRRASRQRQESRPVTAGDAGQRAAARPVVAHVP